MNVLYLINFAGKGGTEKYVEILAKSLLERGHKPYLMYNIEGTLCMTFEEMGIKPVRLKMRNPFDIIAAFKVAAYCRTNNISLIHTQHGRENYISILAKLFYPSLKVVFTSHFAIEQNKTWKFTNKFMLRRNDYIIAVCNIVKKYLLINNGPENLITVITNGVPYADYTHNVQGSKIRKEFKLRDFMFLFVTLTRFTEEKGNLFLLESVKELTKKTTLPFKVMLVGDGKLLSKCKLYVEDNELSSYVIFTGYRTDTENILKAANCYINSSREEAHSFAILEAMAKALPVIATSVGGNVDIVNNETGCGLLVNYGDADVMAAAMKRLMLDIPLWQSLSDNALSAVCHRFNLETAINKTLGLYEILTDSFNTNPD